MYHTYKLLNQCSLNLILFAKSQKQTSTLEIGNEIKPVVLKNLSHLVSKSLKNKLVGG